MLGIADAVTEPLAIRVNSCDNAENGMLNKLLPSPINKDADIEPLIPTEPLNWALLFTIKLFAVKLPLTFTLPLNSEPLSSDNTLNP